MNQDLLHKYFKGETSVDEEKLWGTERNVY